MAEVVRKHGISTATATYHHTELRGVGVRESTPTVQHHPLPGTVPSPPRCIKKRPHQGIGRQQVRITPILELRVPLHAEHEARRIAPYRLDHVIGRMRQRAQAIAEARHALVVDGIDDAVRRAAVPLRQQAALAYRQRMVMVVIGG